MDGKWVMDAGLYAAFLQLGAHLVAGVNVNHQQMIHALAGGAPLLEFHARAGQRGTINFRQLLSPRIPGSSRGSLTRSIAPWKPCMR